MLSRAIEMALSALLLVASMSYYFYTEVLVDKIRDSISEKEAVVEVVKEERFYAKYNDVTTHTRWDVLNLLAERRDIPIYINSTLAVVTIQSSYNQLYSYISAFSDSDKFKSSLTFDVNGNLSKITFTKL